MKYLKHLNISNIWPALELATYHGGVTLQGAQDPSVFYSWKTQTSGGKAVKEHYTRRSVVKLTSDESELMNERTG